MPDQPLSWASWVSVPLGSKVMRREPSPLFLIFLGRTVRFKQKPAGSCDGRGVGPGVVGKFLIACQGTRGCSCGLWGGGRSLTRDVCQGRAQKVGTEVLCAERG